MAAAEEAWAEFVRSKATRLLYSGGAAALTSGDPLGQDVLEPFLDRLTGAGADIQLLAKLYFLLQPRVRIFIFEGLAELLRSASHIAAGATEVSRGGIRGKVLWPGTYRLRASGRGDHATFVVRRVERSPDVPENQLLGHFLAEILATIETIRDLVGSGDVIEELLRARSTAETALKSSYLRDVTKVPEVTSLMRQRALRNRNSWYREVAELQGQFEETVSNASLMSVVYLVERNWLKPVEPEDLFELFLLVLAIDILEVELEFTEVIDYSLIRQDRAHVAHLRRPKDGCEAFVYFDHSPMGYAGVTSEYKKVLAGYLDSPQGAEHRPDVSIEFRWPPSHNRWLLLDVKESDDEDYKRASIYKALGYLHDFHALWKGSPTQVPKFILMFPENITPIPNWEEDVLEIVLASADLAAERRKRLAHLFSSALQT